MSEEITHIRVGNARIGILGLQDAFQQVQGLKFADTDRCRKELLRQVRRLNYIPPGSEVAYTEALWRAFRRWLGETVPEDVDSRTVIKILGPGCAACDRLMKDVIAVLAEIGLAAEVEHVREASRIGEFGLVAIPALVMNGKLVSSGRTPTRRQLKEIITLAGSGRTD